MTPARNENTEVFFAGTLGFGLVATFRKAAVGRPCEVPFLL